MTTTPPDAVTLDGIDAQIWVIENCHEIVFPGNSRNEILDSLRKLKEIREAQSATMPEPVAYAFATELKRVKDYGFAHAELTNVNRFHPAAKVALYGPEVLTYYGDLLAAEKLKLAKVMEGLREPTREMILAGSEKDNEICSLGYVYPNADVESIFKAMSAALIRSVETPS